MPLAHFPSTAIIGFAQRFFILRLQWVVPLSAQAKQYAHHVDKELDPRPDNYKVASMYCIL